MWLDFQRRLATFSLPYRQPILSMARGRAIFVRVPAFNFVGNALRDVLDPRLRGIIQ
jgi:ABC-type dipeptide/oligopeptide/nickel transport system permease subunit